MFTAFLIKYAEIGVKGKNRYLFEEALVKQIKNALKRCEGRFEVTRTPGRIYVEALSEFDYDETVDNLKTVFGISGICPVVHVEDEGFEKLGQDIVKYMDNVYPEKNFTFKVQARRSRKNYPLNSMELNVELGGVVLTMYDSRTNLSKQVANEVRNFLPDNVFKTVIPRTVRLAEAPSFGKTIFEYARFNEGAFAYDKLAKECIKKFSLKTK